MNLLAFREAPITALAAKFPDMKVKGHGGRFDLLEIDAYGSTGPEVRITVLSARRANTGRNYWNVDYAAYVVAAPDRQMTAGDRGLVLASAVMAFIGSYATGQSGEPSAVGYQNLYSAESRERNKHLGAVSWTQLVQLTDETAAELDAFITAAITYDTAPADGQAEATDTVTLPQ
jgi:hypothetical protein